MKIVTTNENTASIKTEIKVTANTKEEAGEVIRAVENFGFELTGKTLKIDTRFYKNMISNGFQKTMTLLNGEKIRIKEYKINHELRIPKAANLKLNNKYSDIEMDAPEGNAELILYNTNLHASDFPKGLSIEAKYSKISVTDIRDRAKLDFYDTDIKFNSCGDAVITSKYSKFEAAKTGRLTIDSYDDDFEIAAADHIKLQAKYSDFVSQANVGDLNLNLYDCNIQVKSAKNGTYAGKYSELKLGDIQKLNVAESYEDNFFMRKTEDIQISESKYSLYEIDEVSSFSVIGYNDEVTIRKLTPSFSGIDMKGKYGKLEIYAGNVPFRVDFKIKYAKLDIPESVKVIKQIKENGDLELIGNETGGKISVEGYDMKVMIKD